MTRPNFVKVSEQLLKKARKANIYYDIVFFYQMKSLSITGAGKKVDFKNQMRKVHNVSSSTFWKRVKRLDLLGLSNNSNTQISLNSYDCLYKLLGYDLSWNTHKKRKGSFKIWKMPIEWINHIDEWILSREIELNQARQRYSIIRKLRCSFSDAETQKVKARIKPSQTKMDLGLSCKKIADLIGFKFPSQGCSLQKKMSDLGLITYVNRKVCIGLSNRKNATYSVGGLSYLQLCNMQTVL